MENENKPGSGANTPEPTKKSEAEIKLEKELEAAKAIISAQNAEMTKLNEQVKSKHKIIEVDGAMFRCLGKGNIHVAGKILKADELIEDLDLVKELIQSGSGLFKKVEAEAPAKKKKGGNK
jgi:uncharacterized metal-binding protein